ncbi:MAG: response regulator [Candidatus Gastranaerophilales bacterium]|nr:response regulator [Candidatus Gastranaerophilales bacterium]MCM1073216.1 response regulator [Bacteroides sp.]
MALVDLDDEFLELFFNITNSKAPANVDLLDLKKQLIEIVDTLKELNKNAKKPFISKALGDDEQEEVMSGPAILVVDDLGVITYQLKVLLSKFDLDIDCSQEIYDAVSKYKKRKYQYVVMDLFIPTEREGFILLTELKKLANSYGIKSTVGVITASPRKEIEQQCKARGADFFLEKNNDWQNQLCKIMEEYISTGKDEDDW